jgi:nucleotide sugar dehydrogenase
MSEQIINIAPVKWKCAKLPIESFHTIGKDLLMLKKKHNRDEAEKVCVIGLGTVGYPTACYIKNHGFSVYGYDKDRRKTMRNNPFKAFSEWSKVPDCGIYVVCVSTGWKNGKPDMSSVFDVCHKISMKGKKTLVCIESTVPVGTCHKLAELFDDVSLVYVPHRYWSEDPKRHGVRQKRVIGALDKDSLAKAMEFYGALQIPLYPLSSLEVAEMVKINENAYRFVQIAFAEALKLLCDRNHIPFDEVRRGANTKWNVTIMEAREGIKGKCLPKDTRYLRYLGKSPLLNGAIEADKQYTDYIKTNLSKTRFIKPRIR